MDEHTISPAGDPFHAASHDQDERPHACLEGWVFISYEDEYGEERQASYLCRRVKCRTCRRTGRLPNRGTCMLCWLLSS